jgi:hypothetical protein
VAEYDLAVGVLYVLIQPQPGEGFARTEASVAMRTSSGSRRGSSPFSSIRSNAYGHR